MPGVAEFDDDQAWFRVMIVQVAKQLLKEATWGVKLRLFVGAGMSMLDMGSDVTMIVVYFSEGQNGNASLLLAMIGTCLFFQFLIAWMQTRTGPRREMAAEMLIALSGIKPGVDAMRVAGGAEMGEHMAVDYLMELTLTKCIEIFSESIPGKLLPTNSMSNTTNTTSQGVSFRCWLTCECCSPVEPTQA